MIYAEQLLFSVQSWLLNFVSTFWWQFDLLILKSIVPTFQYVIEVCKLLGPERLGSLFSTYPNVSSMRISMIYTLRTPGLITVSKLAFCQLALCIL